MQYLSKAYNYYSGINPATLSGAIDVIVVRHVHSDGQVTLASSPFHVRFGKLQVLRAGEKRVTIKLPNNLPAPHVAPFSMKVGETGEAFFVLETTEDVPEELLTSPVVMASEPTELPPDFDEFNQDTSDQVHNHEIEDRPSPQTTPRRPNAILTREPFGETEQQQSHNHLGDVDFLDLNAPRENGNGPNGSPTSDHKSSAVSPSSILDTATSLLPSIPFLGSPPPSTESDNSSGGPKSRAKNAQPEQNQPPNPLTAEPGEDTDLPNRDHKLSELSEHKDSLDGIPAEHLEDHDETGLPKVRPGEGEGPKVVYGKDVVLDMAGYHNDRVLNSSSDTNNLTPDESDQNENAVGGALIESFTQDLLAAIRNVELVSRPRLTHDRLTDSAIPSTSFPVDTPPVHDHVTSDTVSAMDIPLPNPKPPSTPPASSSQSRRFDRGRSEPPPEGDSPSRVTGTLPRKIGKGPIATAAVMDYAWDWGRLPQPPVHSGDVEEFDLSQNMERSKSGSGETFRPERVRADSLPPSGLDLAIEPQQSPATPLKHAEQSPYLLTLTGPNGATHSFELALCGDKNFARNGTATVEEEAAFLKSRVTFQKFMEDPEVVDDPTLVVRYSLCYLTWSTGRDLLGALSLYRRSLAATGVAPLPETAATVSSGSGWSRWWKRSQITGATELPRPEDRVSEAPLSVDTRPQVIGQSTQSTQSAQPAQPDQPAAEQSQTHYAKTLRLSSDQLKQLQLKPGPNTIQFSVTSSYSGVAVCTARLFLWEDTDQVVISDIDGTITKSDALGHVFAAIGRDWTHLGIARLYTDICNNGYKIMYLTSRAIGQADSTREYLKSIAQGEYRLPEGPVIMSPDRLMASLHREVIMRKPELFKMACLRDIQRLFGDKANEAFFAGFGNRITDAMSYRSVGVETSKIYTIDSTGVVKTELLQAAGHRGSYVALNDLVNEVFPPVTTKFKPEFTDFNYWRQAIAEIPLPDFTPPSPALSARSDTSSRYSVLGKIASIGRRSSRQAILPTNQMEASSRPSSPLIGPAMTPDELSEDEDYEPRGSMPGSFESHGEHMPKGLMGDAHYRAERGERRNDHGNGVEGDDEDDDNDEGEDDRGEDDSFDDGAIFDDDILAAGEMKNVPF